MPLIWMLMFLLAGIIGVVVDANFVFIFMMFFAVGFFLFQMAKCER